MQFIKSGNWQAIDRFLEKFDIPADQKTVPLLPQYSG